MVKVRLEKECGCFKKSKYTYINGQNFVSKKDALLQANLIKNYMNQNFCKKHIFDVEEHDDVILIKVDTREKEKIVACGGDISFRSPKESK